MGMNENGYPTIEGLQLEITRPATQKEKDRNDNPITFISLRGQLPTSIGRVRKVKNVETGKVEEKKTSIQPRFDIYCDGKEEANTFAELRKVPNGAVIEVNGWLDSQGYKKGDYTNYAARINVTSVKIIAVPEN